MCFMHHSAHNSTIKEHCCAIEILGEAELVFGW